jgi:hypothetical protein
MLKDKKEVIKHSGAIQIQNRISLLQRRTWNWLLANAFDDLLAKEWYTVPVVELADALSFNSKRLSYLKNSIRAMVSCTVEWNILGKDGEQGWEITSLLAGARIENGILTYAYNPLIRDKLYNPRMYAKINLALQNKFNSKHALALWELCVDYLDESRNYGETSWISLADYRKLMGISQSMYPEFKEFNRRIIKDPIKEINEVTDFYVDADYKRQKRRVIAVKFKVRRIKQLPKPKRKNKGMEKVKSPEDTQPVGLSQELINRGIKPKRVATELCENRDEDYIREKIEIFDFHMEANDGTISKNPAGWLITAIERDIKPTPKQIKAGKDAIREKADEKIRELKKLIEGEKEKQWQEREIVVAKIIEENPSVLDEVNKKVKGSFMVEKIADYQSVREAYDQSPLVKAEIERIVRGEMFPDMFKDIDEKYGEKIAKIDKQILELEG